MMRKWAITLLIGFIMVGIGTGITIYEFSNFTFQHYSANTQEKITTQYFSLTPNQPLIIDDDSQRYEILVDDTLLDQGKIEVAEPYIVHHSIQSNTNRIDFWVDINPFKILQATLEGLKNDVIYDFDYNPLIKIYVNSAYAKTYQILSEAEFRHNGASESRLNQLQKNYENQLEQQEQSYQQQLDQIQENYENQIQQLEERIQQLEP